MSATKKLGNHLKSDAPTAFRAKGPQGRAVSKLSEVATGNDKSSQGDNTNKLTGIKNFSERRREE